MAQPPVNRTRERIEEAGEQARLTLRRLLGLDRSGPPPAQTLSDQPWRVWTIPNAIGFVRLALIPVFLVLAISSESGTDALPAVIFAVVAWSDYADGMVARITGQYSRLGAAMDPVVDRLLVLSGVVACWYHDLLPRWALAVLVGRELFMLMVGTTLVRRGVQLPINWWGRLSVWPIMSAIFFGLVGLRSAAAVLLYVGLAMAIVATVRYGRRAAAQLATGPST